MLFVTVLVAQFLFILPSQVFVYLYFLFFRAGIFKNAPKKSTRSVVDLFANAIFFKEKSYLDITKKYCFTYCWNKSTFVFGHK